MLDADSVLVDRFLQAISQTSRLLAGDYIPFEIWDGPDPYPWIRWRPWLVYTPREVVEAFEARVGRALPPLYLNMIARYRFPSLELPKLSLFSNLPWHGLSDLETRMFGDKWAFKVLGSHGLTRIGSPSGSSDYLCIGQARQPSEAPIVLVPHEPVLMYGKVRIEEVIFPSLRALMEDTVSAEISRA